jgi:hypothetical protein
VIDVYIEAMKERGERAEIIGEGSIDLLQSKDKQQIRIHARSVFKQYSSPPSNRYLNRLMQHLKLEFTDKTKLV